MAIWRTTIEQLYRAPGGPGYSTMHFRHDGVESDLVSDLTAAQTALMQALGRQAASLPTSTTWRTSGLWQDVGGTSEVTTGRATVVGTASNPAVLPSATALVMGWRTENRSRRGRGRLFLSGYGTFTSEDGTPTATLMTQAANTVTDLVAFNAGAANGAWCVYSELDAVARDITGGAVRDIWAVLRSRRD